MKPILIWAAISVILGSGTGCSTSSGPDNRASSETSNTGSPAQNSSGGPNSSNTASLPSSSFQARDRRKDRANVNTNAKPEPLVFRAAPENSESATTMTADGSILEIRVFKSHPQIARVESLWVDPKDKLLRVYLKNGRMIEVRTDRLSTLRSAKVVEILEVAGIRNTQKLADPSRLVDRK